MRLGYVFYLLLSTRFYAMQRLELHVRRLNEVRLEDRRRIQELEKELKNCHQEIGNIFIPFCAICALGFLPFVTVCIYFGGASAGLSHPLNRTYLD